jgi:DNA mismatch repair protein MutS2
LQVIAECRQLLESGPIAQFQDLVDYVAVFDKLVVAELALEPQEILNIERLLECSEATRKSLRAVAQEAPATAEVGRRLPEVGVLLSTLKGKIASNGEIEDHASPLLKRIRNEINILRNRLYQTLGKILERHSASHAIQDEVITLRNERFVIPCPGRESQGTGRRGSWDEFQWCDALSRTLGNFGTEQRIGSS